MSEAAAVSVSGLVHRYGEREALRSVEFAVGPGEIFGLLGPNGGGKTTLFRILATALVPSGGRAEIFDYDVITRAAQVRRLIGVVFQTPSLDKKLSAAENLWHHGHLYGLRGAALRERTAEMLARVGLRDRAHDRVERLSGGLQRRVELAKGLLHQPRLLLMDEPSSGLDPGARRDLWEYLRLIRSRDGLAVLLTTHLMDEAAQCDRVAILHRGSLVAIGTPHELTHELEGEIVSLQTGDPRQLAETIRAKLGLNATVLGNTVRLEHDQAHELVGRLYQLFPGEIDAVTVRRPSLEDVFIRRTGHRFWEEQDQNQQSAGIRQPDDR
jgi:ABC-2 type transport system ATP-binding protein